MRLINRGLQDRQWIGNFVQILTRRAERVCARRIQLDPVCAMRTLVPDSGTCLFRRSDDRGSQGVFRDRWIFRFRTPNDAQGRDLIAWTIDSAIVDRIPNRDVAVPVAV